MFFLMRFMKPLFPQKVSFVIWAEKVRKGCFWDIKENILYSIKIACLKYSLKSEEGDLISWIVPRMAIEVGIFLTFFTWFLP